MLGVPCLLVSPSLAIAWISVTCAHFSRRFLVCLSINAWHIAQGGKTITLKADLFYMIHTRQM